MNSELKLLAACLLMAGSVMLAQPVCVPGTLAIYEALGSTRCTLDGNVFYNFIYTGTSTCGAARVTANEVMVTPAFLARATAQLTFSDRWNVLAFGTKTSLIRSKLYDSHAFLRLKTLAMSHEMNVVRASLSGFTASLNLCYLCP